MVAAYDPFMTHTHNNLTPAPETVKELFANIDRYADNIGEGKQAVAYRFKHIEGLEGLRNFVIRVPKSCLLKRDLEASTSLTPASRIVSKIHIGNRLMEMDHPIDHSHLGTNNKGEYINTEGWTLSDPNERISISLFQEGNRLGKEWTCRQQINMMDHPDDFLAYSEVRATIDMVNMIKELVAEKGFNPYTRMFKKAYALIRIGLEPDISFNNILYSPKNKTMRMVDQENKVLKKPIESEAEAQALLKEVADTHFTEFYCAKALGLLAGGIEDPNDGSKAILPEKYKHLTNLQLAKKFLPPKLYKEYSSALGDILSLLQKAGKEAIRTDAGRDDPDGSGLPTIPRKIEFAQVDSSHAVALEQPPKVLLLQLQRIVQTADITR